MLRNTQCYLAVFERGRGQSWQGHADRPISVSSWDNFEKQTVAACEKISKTERKQASNITELQKYAKKQSKVVNETANVNYDKLLSLMLG